MDAKALLIRLAEANAANSGHDLFMAERQFSGMSDEQMGKMYGKSGNTCREVLDNCKRSDAEAKAALALARSL